MKTCRYLFQSRWRGTAAVLAVLMFVVFFYLPTISIAQSSASDEGNISLSYASELPNLSNGNTLYSLADAHFGIYSDYQCTQRAGELVTDEDGHATSSPLPAGRYFIKEELASPGFALSAQLYQVDVAIGASATVETSATPDFSAPDVIIREINAETGNPAGVAGAHLGGASYTLSHFDSFDDNKIIAGPTRTWTFESDDNGEVRLSDEYLVSGSSLYEGPHGLRVLPLGHYTLTVNETPTGFTAVNGVLSCDVSQRTREDIEPLQDFEPFEETFDVIRGDVMFRKTDENGTTLAGIPFLLSYANGEDPERAESHVIVTNEYGDYTSSAERIAHDANVNGNDAAILAHVDGVYKIDEEKLATDTGIWFSADSDGMRCNPDNARGALPYGSYVLQELPCSANEKMNLVTTQFSINRDGFTVKLDNIVDTCPTITGSVVDAADGDRLVRPVQDANAVETVSYRNLIVGKCYRLNCSALVQSTGENVPGADGTPAFSSMELVPLQSSGKVEMPIELNTTELAGERIAIRIELIDENGMSIEQNDADNTNQVLDVEPIIIATACDAADYDGYIMGPDAIVKESISYDGLKPGHVYTASCTLNDKATGNTLRDAQGKVISACVEFTPDNTAGCVDMELLVDTTAIAGHDIVAFDRMSDVDGHVIANHQDMEDELQTIKTVKLSSNATDKIDGDKVFDASSSNVTITDTVSYANLVPGEQYYLKGVLMDKETGCALTANGAPINAEVPFVPQEVSGTTDVEYNFNANAQSSQVLVAFETLEHEGNVVAEHTDLEDVAQTVTSSEVDPDAAPSGQAYPSSADGKGAMTLTGDLWARIALMALVTIAGICACAAYAIHRRRRTLEAIAHSDEPFK